MKRKSIVMSVSMSPKEEQTVIELAEREGRTRSQIIREALRRYRFDSTLSEMQEFGKKIAIKLNIESDDDVETIAG